MQPYVASTPKIPIPFCRLLKIVALVDDEQSRRAAAARPAHRGAVSKSRSASSYGRDPAEDADVGAYIFDVDGPQRDKAREFGLAVRRLGFRTPIWALADSRKISDVIASGVIGEVDGFIYLGQQSPAYYAKQIVASVVDYGTSLLPPFFGGMMAYDVAANVAFACPGHQGGQFYRKSPAGTAVLQVLRRADLPQRPLQCRRRARRPADPCRRRGRGATQCRAHLRRGPHLLRAQWHFDLEQGRDRRRSSSGRPGAVRPQQSQVDAPGRAGAGRRHSGVPAHRAQFLRHDRRGRLGCLGRKDAARAHPQSSARQGQETRRRRTPVPHGLHPARHLRRHGLQRAQGHGEDWPSL